jgi:uncharacterized protein (DUF2126 family)/transglutaminase-like putative cysteine protease
MVSNSARLQGRSGPPVLRAIGILALIRIAIEHRTVYRYDRPIRLGPHVIRLRPAPHCRTPILAYSLSVKPDDHFVNWQQDPSGNHLARCVFPEPTGALEITVDLVADMTVINPFDFFIDEAAHSWPFSYDAGLAQDLAPYLAPADAGPLVDAWAAAVPRTPTPLIDFLVGLNRSVRDDVDYSVRMEHGVQTPDETLRLGVGSCRDSAWLLVSILRRLGIAARFASGYLVQLAPDQPGPTSPTSDSTDLHAWAEAYVPGAGWVGLDPTSGLLAGEGHIPLACTSTPAAAAPIEGSRAPAETEFEFSNLVTRFAEEPRVTLPYTNAQWERIDALGLAVDDALDRGDVRLTMGGEPTFVAIGSGLEAEWNIAADGPTKRPLATALGIRLADRLAPGALIAHNQGKWYPGEPLPRWQVAVNWRTDGHPLWRDPDLLADPTSKGESTAAETLALAERIAAGLGLPAEICVPAYEDPVGRLWTEARLPDGEPPSGLAADPPDPALALAAARAAIIAALDAERGAPKGVAIPLHRAAGDDEWTSGRWTIRRGALFLIAGDSPIGMRLPLASISWSPPPADPELSLFAAAPDLPPIPLPAQTKESEPPPITALCVELREGNAHVFLPPLNDFGHFAELVAVIEAAAQSARTPVVIEGYPPPSDTRLEHFSVTPDPGVIEVNIHPSDSWPNLVANTTTIYDEATAVGLSAEKFALDGLHTATGGGSHLTLGGPRPADSPLLRRPDLLRSLLTFWQHHPSLSYLFSGRFVGPTSQAPRVDEGRHESLYELEIAFAELDRLAAEDTVFPWHVDRLLRNLLVDLSGNTHRAEFCIDKLFSPESERGRLGVVELRGFEMAPHPQMALVQALLVRALVARFWAEPYTGPLVRWGTELHDRFLLPWWIAADIRTVADDLARHGFPFDAAWVDPFLEFRFPRLGITNVDGVSIELRAAIEPWNVLGEDAAAGSSRFVDSSLERIQVRVDGLTPSRHAIACNGFLLPLHPTGTPGSFVAGVRFRARRLNSALHPTIGVHSPLHFDLVDRWSRRSLGGATYHVVHPGGRSYDRVPANAKEAEARRASRFETSGHAEDVVELDGSPETGQDGIAGTGEYPRTLDLRRARRR